MARGQDYYADHTKPVDLTALQRTAQLSQLEWEEALDYSAQVLSNLCHYKSFGATKFIPRCPPSTFHALLSASQQPSKAAALWELVKDDMYSLQPVPLLDIGKPSAGHLSNYYPNSQHISDLEINLVQAVCDAHQLSTLNTRLVLFPTLLVPRRKLRGGLLLFSFSPGLVKHSPTEFSLLIASVTDTLSPDLFPSSPLKSTSQPPLTIHLKPSDFSRPLNQVCAALAEAKKHCGSEIRAQMIDEYIKCFKEGDMGAHKAASKLWVKDVSPVVESYLGHIEAYVDPFALRAEWEGFTAIVNKDLSLKFEQLVNRAEHLVQCLPWGKPFEVDVFRRPDFTALEILNFATGGIPAGINIPNYFDVRESTGFKNVSLENCTPNGILGPSISRSLIMNSWDTVVVNFCRRTRMAPSISIPKRRSILCEIFLFFVYSVPDLDRCLFWKPVESWYKPGETYGSKFGVVASSMEECRAEAVALYLCSNIEILKIFGYEEPHDIETIQYMTFLLMARAGVRALEWYDPKTQKHGQAHMQARLGITKWMIDHGLAQLEEVRAPETGTLEDAYIRVNKQMVLEKGKEIIGKLLIEMQIRKSIADGKGAESKLTSILSQFYNELTTPPSQWEGELRDLVIRKKQARKIFVQPNTILVPSVDARSTPSNNDCDQVHLIDYPTTNIGVIESFLNRNI
ncbi:dipeptidyl-peptidase III [Puccinia sorghi]|uniref:dipeptidyl-peptidase III n=1 Tax=Puccinia sorghi TaxID=27349 RepID=A0A0L6U5M2_9BASI|nr:dipeptidyl-peptidase III [Puccinia sorghi]